MNLWFFPFKRKERIRQIKRKPTTNHLKQHYIMDNKKKNIIEIVVKVIVAALTAFVTAITTTSCMGHGPFFI